MNVSESYSVMPYYDGADGNEFKSVDKNTLVSHQSFLHETGDPDCAMQIMC